MDEQEKNKKKTLRVLIIILLVLLILSILALGSCAIRNYTAKEASDMVVVKDNIITLENDTSKDEDNLVDGESNLKEDSEDVNNSLKEESSSEGDSSKEDSVIEDGSNSNEGNGSNDEVVAGKPEVNITLSNKNDSENVPFKVSNMLPGDKDVKYFRLKVSYKDSVTVKFRANIKPGYEKLAEVLRCKVVLPESGEILYDGLMMDMPKSLNHTMNSKNDKSGEIYYEITTYLDTNVGNEYMNKALKADFSWWIDEA